MTNTGYKMQLAEKDARVDQLRAELAEALAACKAKDEALMLPCDRWNKTQHEIVKNAIAIQPGDAALKAWLGEPVAYLYKHSSAFGDGVFWSHRPNHNGAAALETKALYSPKGLK